MLNNIFLKFSEFAMLGKEDHTFFNKYRATAEAVLTEYKTNEELVSTSLEDLAAFISSKSRGRIANPQETSKAPADSSKELLLSGQMPLRPADNIHLLLFQLHIFL